MIPSWHPTPPYKNKETLEETIKQTGYLKTQGTIKQLCDVVCVGAWDYVCVCVCVCVCVFTKCVSIR